MGSNQQEDKNVEIRALFLQGGYGQFNFLEQIFTQRELLHSVPRVLIKQLCFRLSIQKDDFKQDSFRHWLTRYRKGATPKPKFIGGMPTSKSTSTEKPKGSTFQFSDPSTLKKKEEPLIHIVNDQNQHT